jgi:CRISPR/Cas system-associated protein endoribonuclease Cas2
MIRRSLVKNGQTFVQLSIKKKICRGFGEL